MAQVLIIEDDPRIRPLLMRSLDERGHAVTSAATGMQGLAMAVDNRPDLVILDLGLPDVDGTQVLQMLRAVSDVPVIVASARDDDPSLVGCLNAGADDYVVKPFSPKELVLRVNSVLRRSLPEFAREAPFQLGPFHLDPSARIATKHGAALELSVREFDLFAFLLKHPRQTFDRPTLLRSVWGWEIGDLSTVTVTTRRLREKIEEDPGSPTVLVTVWGVGYRLELGSL